MNVSSSALFLSTLKSHLYFVTSSNRKVLFSSPIFGQDSHLDDRLLNQSSLSFSLVKSSFLVAFCTGVRDRSTAYFRDFYMNVN